ncbi:hypothetical protein RND71_019643 [Anisodus tanguticus]|uniref:Pentatricopeptide repeat-containing protein n=1 Tax=Anisodus tanguticus TaxID=243964 RepID=A0AAE1RZH7_9SOLA|nr:hypothetical protein RND71_019643 [Anisodus tanguticus]
MRHENALPNPQTFAGILTSVSTLGDAFTGKQDHCLAFKLGYFSDVFVGSSLLNMYCNAGGHLDDARKVFDEMPERDYVSWTTMISGYARRRLLRRLWEWKQIHGLSLKNGFLWIVSVANATVTMYAKCGNLDDACWAFELSSEKNSITWSALITGYAQNGDCEKALKLFSEMHLCGMNPRFEPQMYILIALVDMYAKCGNISDAIRGFDYLKDPDIVLWTSMIAGYVKNGDSGSGMGMYCRMLIESVVPNELTMASVLKACSSLAALE